VKKGSCEEDGRPLGQPKLLSNIEDRQKKQTNEDSFKEIVHLYLSSIFSYLLKFLFFNLQQYDRFVDDIAKVNFGCTTFHTEHFIGRTGALELEVGLLLAITTLGHIGYLWENR